MGSHDGGGCWLGLGLGWLRGCAIRSRIRIRLLLSRLLLLRRGRRWSGWKRWSRGGVARVRVRVGRRRRVVRPLHSHSHSTWPAKQPEESVALSEVDQLVSSLALTSCTDLSLSFQGGWTVRLIHRRWLRTG